LGQNEQGPVVQGWCPGALRPMMSGDGLVVRVRPRLGRLSAAQARGVAALSREHGNGLIDLSARANVQLRGVSTASHPPLIEGLRALGLIDDSVAQETRRNIVVAPFHAPGDPTLAICTELARLLARPDAAELPGKFGFAVDTGAVRVLEGTACDIRIERDAHGVVLRPDGSRLAKRVTAATAATEALALTRWFVETGGIHEGRGRMAAHVARFGVPQGFILPATTQDFLPRPGLCDAGALVALAFGQMTAETLQALAGLGDLRITPWRMIVVEGATALPDLPGLISDPTDPLLHVVACTGAPGCVQALGPTRDLARALAPHVQGLLHVSGCAKGCAHPGAADLTLTATPQGFALIRGATAHDTPFAHHSAAALIARPDLLTE
jgi:precorrin-3B synthase